MSPEPSEGVINDVQEIYVTLIVEDHVGDLIANIDTSTGIPNLGGNLSVGWLSTTMGIHQLVGRNVHDVASVKLKLGGNDNRLSWHLVANSGPIKLPERTTLFLTKSRTEQST